MRILPFLLLMGCFAASPNRAPRTNPIAAFQQANRDFQQQVLNAMPALSAQQEQELALNLAFTDWAFDPRNRDALREVYSMHFDPEWVSQALLSNERFLEAASQRKVQMQSFPQHVKLNMTLFVPMAPKSIP